jgi:hypothetical protein
MSDNEETAHKLLDILEEIPPVNLTWSETVGRHYIELGRKERFFIEVQADDAFVLRQFILNVPKVRTFEVDCWVQMNNKQPLRPLVGTPMDAIYFAPISFPFNLDLVIRKEQIFTLEVTYTGLCFPELGYVEGKEYDFLMVFKYTYKDGRKPKFRQVT